MGMDYKLIEETIFNSYKSFMEFLRLTNKNNVMYTILVLRKPLCKGITSVNIIINSININDENNSNNYNYKTNTVLPETESRQLIEDIRIDFRDNHYVSYSTVNESNLIQTLQNTNFSLNIKLLNEDEINEALSFNEKINSDGNRHKVLNKN